VALVCVDASIVISWLFQEELSDRAFEARSRWKRQSDRLVAPPMLTFEAPSVIRQSVHREGISESEGDEALQAFLDFNIEILQPAPLVYEAWSIGKALDAPRLYDMYYVALSSLVSCEMWTADERLFNLARRRHSFVRWLGDSLP
jgi:predicted nucleic acid-binding protein